MRGSDTGGVSPFIMLKCGNLPAQKTFANVKTSSAVWNQSFTFPELHLNKYELETSELVFEAYDENRWQ